MTNIIIFLSAGIILELACVPLGAITGLPTVFFITHIIAVAFLVLSFYMFDRKNDGMDEIRAAYGFCLVMISFFPGIGIGVSILILLTKYRYRNKEENELYEEYEKYIERGSAETRETEMFSSLTRKMRDEVSFEPFVDVIRGENIAMKERVIEKLTKLGSRNSVQLLKEALKDVSPEVRLYAAGALLKMEASLSDKIQSARERVKQRGTAADFVYLGDLYRTYSDIGLTEESLTRHYLSLSCDAYKDALDIDTNQPGVVVNYTHTLLRLERYERARIFLDKAVQIWPDNNEIVFLRGEVYFQLGEFVKVGNILKDIKEDTLDEGEKEVFCLWAKEM